MNYIEYMSGGGTTDSTYYKEIPLEEKWGPKSTLTLKRNNWIKAIRDVISDWKYGTYPIIVHCTDGEVVI